MDIVRKIIRAYLYNPMPEKVQRQFRSWCLREEGSHEKTEALREEWERLDPAAVLPTDEEAYRGKLARLHGEMRPPLRLRTIPLSRRAAAVAAAVVVLAMSVEFFVVRHLTADSTTVLVTAENSKGRFTLRSYGSMRIRVWPIRTTSSIRKSARYGSRARPSSTSDGIRCAPSR